MLATDKIRPLPNVFVAFSRFKPWRITSTVLLAVGVIVVPGTTYSQSAVTAPAVPQIVVTATGEVKVSPDIANIQLGVETRALTAAAAAAENSKKQTSVLASLKSLGIPSTAITTSNFSVSPIQRWNETTKRTVIDGYQVSNLVSVQIAKIELTGAVIDGALAAGANRVASLTFELADPTKAREDALTKAVTQAKRDAEVAARAAGGSVSDLLEVVVNQFEQPGPRPMMMMARGGESAAPPTPVSEGTMTVQVNVTTRWLYARSK